MTTQDFQTKTKQLIDELKGICANYGLGNDGNEFKIITQVFLYKFLNDKFAYELKKLEPAFAETDDWAKMLATYKEEDYEMLTLQLSADVARLKPVHFISHLFDQQNKGDFAKTFDDTLRDIAMQNNEIFSVKTEGGAKVILFDRLSDYISDGSKRDAFCRAIINKLTNFSFEHIFGEKYDFYATIFEYLIKDYNSNSGGKYAEYFTPHAVAKIMAKIMVTEDVKNVTCYDPSAGSGTLLMNLAHAIGEDKCTIYSQDISQKSSSLLRLNLILNNLVHSIQNIIQGNTLTDPYHKDKNGSLQKFDYIVSNPPFKLDFSEYREQLDSKENHERFFAGVPKVPKKDKKKMAIYQCFLQHIMHVLGSKGKAAVVVPTGFITAPNRIDRRIREQLVERRMLAGVVSMPSNIFATTGTNVSILFLDRTSCDKVVLMDASKLGTLIKMDEVNQKTVLSEAEEDRIIYTFNQKKAVDDFSVVVGYDDIQHKNYSFSAGQYFEVKIEHLDITSEEFDEQLDSRLQNLSGLFSESRGLEIEIEKQLKGLKLHHGV